MYLLFWILFGKLYEKYVSATFSKILNSYYDVEHWSRTSFKTHVCVIVKQFSASSWLTRGVDEGCPLWTAVHLRCRPSQASLWCLVTTTNTHMQANYSKGSLPIKLFSLVNLRFFSQKSEPIWYPLRHTSSFVQVPYLVLMKSSN